MRRKHSRGPRSRNLRRQIGAAAVATILTVALQPVSANAQPAVDQASAQTVQTRYDLYDESTWPAGAADDDGDGIPNVVECPRGHQRDTDGDGIPNCEDPDDDGDSIPTEQELGLDTDGDGIPNFEDTDDDGDSWSTLIEAGFDTDGDGIPNDLDADDDNDGIDSIDEFEGDSDNDGFVDRLDADNEDGLAGDSDGDERTNGQEACAGSDPDDADSDNDLVSDTREIGPFDPCTQAIKDTDGDGTPDVLDIDDDNDGISTRTEAGAYGLDPTVVGGACAPLYHEEPARWADPDSDGLSNHRDTDSDNDGVDDRVEWPQSGWSTPVTANTATSLLRSNWNDAPDNDGDGIPDHLDTYDEDGPLGDLDGDGLTNCDEIEAGTSPFYSDSDYDSLTDDEEQGDFDGDGIIDALDTDDDNDGLATIDEGGDYDFDGDGLGNHHDVDSDNDGLLDSIEGLGHADNDGVANFMDLDSDDDGIDDSDDDDPTVPCGMIPDGDNDTWHCWDQDCDGIWNGDESQQLVYEPDTGVPVFTVGGGTTYQAALADGPCATADYDCDWQVNWLDDDWTDGPGENYEGVANCVMLNP